MLSLAALGEQIATRRKHLKLSQKEVASHAGVARSTLDALENGRLGELGFSKTTKILAALGLELKLQKSSAGRPTLDDLLNEDRA